MTSSIPEDVKARFEAEATTPRLDTVLAKIKTTAGPSTAKTCRAIISGAMKLAVRYGALTVNPLREVDVIEAPTKNPPRALTREEVTLLRKSLAADEHAVEADIPDLTTFMLGTGVRIGESLAVLWHQVDFDAGTVEITHTVARLTGQGLIRKATKSKTGERRLHPPNWTMAMLRTHSAGSPPPPDGGWLRTAGATQTASGPAVRLTIRREPHRLLTISSRPNNQGPAQRRHQASVASGTLPTWTQG